MLSYAAIILALIGQAQDVATRIDSPDSAVRVAAIKEAPSLAASIITAPSLCKAVLGDLKDVAPAAVASLNEICPKLKEPAISLRADSIQSLTTRLSYLHVRTSSTSLGGSTTVRYPSGVPSEHARLLVPAIALALPPAILGRNDTKLAVRYAAEYCRDCKDSSDYHKQLVTAILRGVDNDTRAHACSSLAMFAIAEKNKDPYIRELKALLFDRSKPVRAAAESALLRIQAAAKK